MGALGGGLLPPDRRSGGRRHPGAHPHVLLGVQRHHGAHRAPGRRRALDRGLTLGHGGTRRLRRLARLPERDRAGRVRHPLAARAACCGNRAAARARRGARRPRAAVGQPRLWPQDAALGGGSPRARTHTRGDREAEGRHHGLGLAVGALERVPAWATTGVGSLPFTDPERAAAHAVAAYDSEWLGADPRRCGWSPERDRERPRAWGASSASWPSARPRRARQASWRCRGAGRASSAWAVTPTGVRAE